MLNAIGLDNRSRASLSFLMKCSMEEGLLNFLEVLAMKINVTIIIFNEIVLTVEFEYKGLRNKGSNNNKKLNSILPDRYGS